MLTLLKFKADWCKPCKAMIPVVDALKEQNPDVIFQDVDIDNDPQLRADYGIRSIPSFVVLKDRKEVKRKIGSSTLSELKELLDECRGL